MHTDQAQFCRGWLTVQLCRNEQLLVSMADKTRLFPSLLGIQSQGKLIFYHTRTISIPVASAERSMGERAARERKVSLHHHLTTREVAS
jgi:hypothetical protein